MNGRWRFVRTAAGRQLRRQYRETFLGRSSGVSIRAGGWRAAAASGATFEWALQAAGATVDEAAINQSRSTPVGWALQIAAAIPVSVADGLLMYGWTVAGLNDLMTLPSTKKPDVDFPETAWRLTALHRVAPETCGADYELLWRAFMAICTAGNARLTDLQALRWLQVLEPRWSRWNTEGFVWLNQVYAETLREWVSAAGPEGWAWPAAGYTPDQTRVLLALPETHPDRPGPDQLAVMAALRDR